MYLKEAQAIADEIFYQLILYCEKISIAGSIRRCKAEVKDVDIVLIPNNPGKLSYVIDQMGTSMADGDKLRRLVRNGTQVDIYYATPRTWATLLLIRTGSVENNIRLCKQAKRLGMKLKANGDGIIDVDGQLITIDSEEKIYEILRLPYQEPWER